MQCIMENMKPLNSNWKERLIAMDNPGDEDIPDPEKMWEQLRLRLYYKKRLPKWIPFALAAAGICILMLIPVFQQKQVPDNRFSRDISQTQISETTSDSMIARPGATRKEQKNKIIRQKNNLTDMNKTVLVKGDPFEIKEPSIQIPQHAHDSISYPQTPISNNSTMANMNEEENHLHEPVNENKKLKKMAPLSLEPFIPRSWKKARGN